MSWQPPLLIDHNGVITGYMVEYTNVRTSESESEIASETMLPISGLVPFVEYSVTVAAINVNGTGDRSDPEVQTSGQASESMTMIICCIVCCSFRTHCTKITNGSWCFW